MPIVNISKTLTGDEAVAYLSQKYDWNVYCPDFNVMSIIAYRQKRFGNALTYDPLREHVFRQLLCADWDSFIAIALDDEKWLNQSWYEHDSWEGDPEWVVRLYNASSLFATWFDQNIVDYEIE